MKITFNNQSRKAGIALAAVTFVTFVTTSALAAPTPKPLTFAKADISIATRTSEAQEVAAGDLVCSWRETGLTPYALVSYECKAGAVAIVEACVYKGKIISDTELTVATDLTNAEPGHEAEVFLANNSGAVSGEVIVAAEAPHGGGNGHVELCPNLGHINGPEPEQEVVAVRWCDMSLTDTTNDLVGAQVTELFEVLAKGAFAVPSCAEILP